MKPRRLHNDTSFSIFIGVTLIYLRAAIVGNFDIVPPNTPSRPCGMSEGQTPPKSPDFGRSGMEPNSGEFGYGEFGYGEFGYGEFGYE
jgi:hypothetical protein